jgi:hypothetical protein
MKHLIRFAPPNGIFFLEDAVQGKSPDIDDRPVRVWSTRSCIIVGCLPWVDGETEMIVSASAEDALSTEPAFDGVLDTPNRVFRVSTSEKETLATFPVAGHFTRVRVWTNHPIVPDHILVVLG